MSRPTSADRLRADGQPIGDVYLDRAAIAARVAELGAELAEAYAGTVPLLVAPLKSSAVEVDVPDRFAVRAEAVGGGGAAHEAIRSR